MRLLEVGSYFGGTLYHWLTNAHTGATVVSVDLPPADTRQSFDEWVPDDVSFHQITGHSADPGTLDEVAKLGPYDWIFIDAGHLYDEVKTDWDNYRPLATDEAVIALHDIVPGPHLEVLRLWREIQARGYVTQEIICDHVADWGGIGVVYL